MIKIYIFADSYKHFKSAIDEYEKRLGKSLDIIKLKPSKKKEDKLVVLEETNSILSKLEKEKGFKIILNPSGIIYNTNDFYNLIEGKKSNFGNIIIAIGGANGFDYDLLKDKVGLNLSLGGFTMPHSMALLVILEQMYRLEMIKKGTSYNK